MLYKHVPITQHITVIDLSVLRVATASIDLLLFGNVITHHESSRKILIKIQFYRDFAAWSEEWRICPNFCL